jgi:hypothetical protein
MADTMMWKWEVVRQLRRVPELRSVHLFSHQPKKCRLWGQQTLKSFLGFKVVDVFFPHFFLLFLFQSSSIIIFVILAKEKTGPGVCQLVHASFTWFIKCILADTLCGKMERFDIYDKPPGHGSYWGNSEFPSPHHQIFVIAIILGACCQGSVCVCMLHLHNNITHSSCQLEFVICY